MKRAAKFEIVAVTVLSVLLHCRYWIASAIWAPGQGMDIWTLYRYADTQFMASFGTLTRARFGEFAVLEHAGEGILPGQLLQFLFYGPLFGLAGPWGLILLDILVGAGFGLALLFLFRRLKINPALSICFIPPLAGGVLGEVFKNSGAYLFFYWQRWGRPHLTVPVFILILLQLHRISEDEKSPRPWIWLGVLHALLAQFGDPFSAFASAGTIALIWLTLFLRPGSRARTLVKNGVFTWTAGTLGMAPAFFQAAVGTNNSTVFGVYPTFHRFLFEYPGNALTALWIAGIVMAAVMWRVSSQKTFWLFMIWQNVFTMPALPISSFLLGHSAQPYHFLHTVRLVASWTLILAMLQALSWRFKRTSPGALVGAVAASLFLGLWADKSRMVYPSTMDYVRATYPIRSDLPYWSGLWRYRQDLIDLRGELDRPLYRNDLVLGTLDHTLSAWWEVFRDGYVFSPDPLSTTLDEREIEVRLLTLFKLIGLPQPLVGPVLDQVSATLWLGTDKYQFSKAYTYSPMSDYSPEQMQRFGPSIYDSWAIVVPVSEQKRLTEMFQQIDLNSKDMPRLDLIILTNTPLETRLAPPEDRFESTYENPTFRVYRKREG